MSRQILFRGKREDNGEWVEGYYVKGATRHCIVMSLATVPRFDVIPETVGECSFVPDKNGVMMFEGDIVKGLFLFGLSVNAVVAFKNGSFGLEWDRGGTNTFNAFANLCNVEYEVIGTVHDNPELLN